MYHPKYQEFYKDALDPDAESFKVFVEPLIFLCRKQRLSSVHIFEFGLGFGSNLLCLQNHRSDLPKKIQYTVCENEDSCVGNESLHPMIKAIYQNSNISWNNVEIRLITQYEDLSESFDFGFHDPFSIKKNPDGWTQEIWNWYFTHSKENTVIFTYGAASEIRRRIVKAGFHVLAVEGYKKKRESSWGFRHNSLITPWPRFEAQYRNH
jgi:tRNA U34 5-methylaminomethyl-2-thiouridine-forming methyltransferase MnmC